jgi:hypothetical protein
MANTGVDGVNESIVAANQGQPGAQVAPHQEWDGEHLQEAEKTLKEMYIQVRNHPLAVLYCGSHDIAPTTPLNDPKSRRIPSHQAGVP